MDFSTAIDLRRTKEKRGSIDFKDSQPLSKKKKGFTTQTLHCHFKSQVLSITISLENIRIIKRGKMFLQFFYYYNLIITTMKKKKIY